MTHPLADKLRAYDAYEGHNGDAPFAMCFIDEQDRDAAVAEIERLHAIVERLPKTADGVPVVPEMALYWPGREYGYPYHAMMILDDWTGFNAGSFYSTHEAAEAALAAKEARDEN